jgi:hypothetical protein
MVDARPSVTLAELEVALAGMRVSVSVGERQSNCSRVTFLPLPMFSFTVWISLLMVGILLLLCFSPLAFRGKSWLRIVSFPLSIVVGVLNAALQIASSVYFHR